MRRLKNVLALVLALVMLLSCSVPAGAVETADGTKVSFEQVDNSVLGSNRPEDRVVDTKTNETSYRDSDMVRVSIVLEDASTIKRGFSIDGIAENSSAMSYRKRLLAKQEALAETISAQVLGGEKLDVVWNMTLAANMISANVAYGDIEAIEALRGVESVVIETRYEPMLESVGAADPNMATSSEQIGSGAVWAAGYTGAGSKVAIIDTGTDIDHQSFDAEAFEYAIEETGKDVDLLTLEDVKAVFDELNIASDKGVTAEALYLNAKLPFAYNYIDHNLKVTHDDDGNGNHGSHVAGIAAANRYIADGEGGFEDALTVAHTQGVAPDAQIITMKVFGAGGGAYDSDYMVAIEDAVVLGCDSINLSLGSGNPGMSTSDDYQAVMDNLENAGAVVCISAGNSGTWQEKSTNGYLYSDGVSMDMVGTPGSLTNSLAVASVENVGGTGNFLFLGDKAIGLMESTDHGNKPIVTLDTNDGEGTEYDFVLMAGDAKIAVDGSGNTLLTPYADVLAGKIVMVYRGTSSFAQKHSAVGAVNAKACVIVNNQPGTFGALLEGTTSTIPCVCITQADGAAILAAATPVYAEDEETVLYYTGKITVKDGIKSYVGDSEYYTMSDFSSWGVPGSLQMKPEITAPGGNIYSVNGGAWEDESAIGGSDQYVSMSGTSMAAPQVAGMTALVAQYIRENDLLERTGLTQRQLAQSLLMSTAEPIIEEATDYYYSILNQGAGLANVNSAIGAHSFITMAEDATSGATDGKVKVELGDDPEKNGVYTFSYTLHNIGDEDAAYIFKTDVFTQDVFTDSGMDFLDTWTTPLTDAVVTYEINGQPMNNEGLTWMDAQNVLEYCVGAMELTDEQIEMYDFDGDGKITTNDAYLILNVQVPACGSIEVTVTIDVTKCDFSDYPVGAYIEAYSYATELPNDEGVEGTVHSIPVLGFYGNWSDASMYDVGTLADYAYGTEGRAPYLYAETECLTNFLSVKYPGDSTEYALYGNPFAIEETYDPEFNAFNSNGTLAKYYITAIRNAGNALLLINDTETGEIYSATELGRVNSAYYYDNGGKWQGTQYTASVGWAGTDAEGNKLPEGTQVDVSLVLAPEYYVSADGSYDWSSLLGGELGDGAYLTTRVAIDNTAPEMTALTYDAEAQTLTASAKDNRNVAAVYLAHATDEDLEDWDVPAAKEAESEFDVSAWNVGETAAPGYIQVIDYAGNTTTYRFVLSEDGADQSKVTPTAMAITPETAEIVRGTSCTLSLSFQPWMANSDVTWTSSNEDVATVDADGIVTGVDEGTATITATSAAEFADGETPLSATCTVTVKSYNVTITGMLQDTKGDPQLFSWNMETEKTWKKTAPLENYITSATYDFHNDEDAGKLYQMDSSGFLYTVDPATGETLTKSDAAAAFGVPMEDMEHAYITSVLAQQDVLIGIYGPYLLCSFPAADNDFTYGWDMSTYLSLYFRATSFTAIAWAGYGRNSSGAYVDIFYCLTDTGDILVVMPDFATGRAGMTYYETDLDVDFTHDEDSYYCSMVMGDDGNLYLSYFNGTTNEIYVLEAEDIYDGDEYVDTVFHSMLLGDVGDDVWPCALLSVSANETAGEGGDAATNAIDFAPKFTAQAETITLPAAQAATGSLNAVKAERAEAPEKKIISAEDTGRVFVDIVVEDSTNGLVTLTYDSDVLEFVELVANDNAYYAWSTDENTVTLAYASGYAIDGKVATAVFAYARDDGNESADVTVTSTENGDDSTRSTQTLTIKTNAHVHSFGEWTVVRAATQTAVGSKSRTCATCGETETAEIPALGAGKCYYKHFSDCTSGWYHEAVDFVAAHGLMNGMSETTFGPNEQMTRAMVVTVLYRLVGEPSVESVKSFSDVSADQYYATPIAWAKENKIVDGMTADTFCPNLNVTREQIATILWRYEGKPEATAKLPSFNDADKISAYALDALTWAASEGIFAGDNNGDLRPTDNATRAEFATIIMRYLNGSYVCK